MISQAIPFPELDGPARSRWSAVPPDVQRAIINAVWCTACRTSVRMNLTKGEMDGDILVLRGTCATCGHEVARVVEPVED